jgi:hypothetical protein
MVQRPAKSSREQVWPEVGLYALCAMRIAQYATSRGPMVERHALAPRYAEGL